MCVCVCVSSCRVPAGGAYLLRHSFCHAMTAGVCVCVCVCPCVRERARAGGRERKRQGKGESE